MDIDFGIYLAGKAHATGRLKTRFKLYAKPTLRQQ